MEYKVDIASGQNPHVNYEPSVLGGLKEAEQVGKVHEPHYNEKLVRGKIERPNDTGQAGDTYRSFEEWEKEELISNLTEALKVCQPHIQEKMIEHFTHADKDYGRRKSESLAKAMANKRGIILALMMLIERRKRHKKWDMKQILTDKIKDLYFND